MREDLFITSEHLTSKYALFRQFLNSCPNTRCIFSKNDLSGTISATISVLITSDSPGLLDIVLTDKNVPKHIPILVLGKSDVPPSPPPLQDEKRLIDFLLLPVSQDILRYKLLFLDHIKTISAEYYGTLNIHKEVLDNLSKRDGLTGLFNRRHLTETLKNEFQHALTVGEDLSLLILNIDYFNEINRSSGLKFGDAVLNEISARLTVNTRDSDTCYRFSGEDFVILMPQANLELANQTGEKIRTACSSKPFIHFEKQKSITVSIGVASLKTHALKNHDEFISMAETALYMAKAGGRNRVHTLAPSGANQEYSAQQSLANLKETINRILDKTRSSTISSLQLLAKEIAGTKYKNHIDQVSLYIELLGEQLGLPANLILTFQNAITLHNSIRFFLHNDLLDKETTLSKGERKVMDDLPFKLTEITDIFDYFANERTLLLSHSERYDGNGGPHGLKGSEIPLGARLFNIVDSLAAMNSDRPFRPRLDPDAIVGELINEAGKQFDPHLVLHTLNMIRENNLLDLSPDRLEQIHQNMINNFPEIADE